MEICIIAVRYVQSSRLFYHVYYVGYREKDEERMVDRCYCFRTFCRIYRSQ